MIYFMLILSLICYVILVDMKILYEYFYFTPVKNKGQSKKNLIWDFNNLLYMRFYLIGLYLFTSKKPKWKKHHSGKTKFKTSIINGLLGFLSILFPVVLVFSVFQILLDSFTNTDGLESTIFQIEKTQHDIKNSISLIKIGWGYELVILFILITIGSFFPLFEKWKIKGRFKKYTGIIKKTLMVLTISTSFTFFGATVTGNEIGRIEKLEMHKLEIIKNNLLLKNEIEDEIIAFVADDFISNQDINKKLNEIDSTLNLIDSLKKTKEFQRFLNDDPGDSVKIKNLHLNEIDFRKKYGLAEITVVFENKRKDYFSSEWKNENALLNLLSRDEKKWLSIEKVEQAKERFRKVKNNLRKTTGKVYTRYREIFHCLIKKAYNSTFGNYIKDFSDGFGLNIAFFDELINPFNEQITNHIKKESDKIFNCIFNDKDYKIAEPIIPNASKAKEVSKPKFQIEKNTLIADYRTCINEFTAKESNSIKTHNNPINEIEEPKVNKPYIPVCDVPNIIEIEIDKMYKEIRKKQVENTIKLLELYDFGPYTHNIPIYNRIPIKYIPPPVSFYDYKIFRFLRAIK